MEDTPAWRWRCLVLVGIAGLMVSCASHELRQAEQLAAQGQWDRAVVAYREALKKDPWSETIQEQLEAAKTRAAEAHDADGRRHLAAHRLPEALQEFKLAVGLDPSRPEFQAGLAETLRLKEARDQMHAGDKLQALGRLEEAVTAYERALSLDPDLPHAVAAITDLEQQRRAGKIFGTSNQPITLRFQKAKLKEVFEILARTAGVNVIFDKDVRDEPVTIFVKDLPFDEAMQLILNTNGLWIQHVAPDTILVMPNTKQKQAQYQDLLMRTFYLTNAKAKEAVNLVRTMLESKKVYVDERVNAILVREEPAKLQLAEKLLFAIDRREPEVELDVEVLEVNRTKSLKYGINFAKQAGFGIRPEAGKGSISTAPTLFTLEQLTALSPYSYMFTLPASLITDFFKQQSDAKTLASPKLRVLNNKSASISIGNKQPILLSTTNVLPGQAATGAIPTTSTVTSIEFKDVGVKLTVEPSINALDEVALKLKIEVTRLGDQVILQASPEIKQFTFGTRSAETFLMLKDDETVVLAGLIQGEDRKNRSTVPLLGDIPYLGEWLTATTVDHVETEVVLTITPRVVRSMTTAPIADQVFWSGTENTYATSQLFAPRARSVSHGQEGATPSASGDRRQSMTEGKEGIRPSQNPAEPPVRPSGGVPSGAETPARPSGGAESATTSSSQPEGRGPVLLGWREAETTATLHNEIRLDVIAPDGVALKDIMATVSFDQTKLQFQRVGPGAAAVSARSLDGQVIMTLKTVSGKRTAGSPVVSMFFSPKVAGRHSVVMRITNQESEGLESGADQTAMIHVK